jgi:hypothetical protein
MSKDYRFRIRIEPSGTGWTIERVLAASVRSGKPRLLVIVQHLSDFSIYAYLYYNKLVQIGVGYQGTSWHTPLRSTPDGCITGGRTGSASGKPGARNGTQRRKRDDTEEPFVCQLSPLIWQNTPRSPRFAPFLSDHPGSENGKFSGKNQHRHACTELKRKFAIDMHVCSVYNARTHEHPCEELHDRQGT